MNELNNALVNPIKQKQLIFFSILTIFFNFFSHVTFTHKKNRTGFSFQVLILFGEKTWCFFSGFSLAQFCFNPLQKYFPFLLDIDCLKTWQRFAHLFYHLYNWHSFQRVLFTLSLLKCKCVFVHLFNPICLFCSFGNV